MKKFVSFNVIFSKKKSENIFVAKEHFSSEMLYLTGNL